MLQVSEDGDSDYPYTFTLFYSAEKCYVLAASSEKERELWLNDLQDAINQCQQLNIVPANLALEASEGHGGKIINPSGSGDDTGAEASETQESEEEGPSNTGPDKVSYHRSNTTMHVCWHRQTSVSMNDHIKSVHVSQIQGFYYFMSFFEEKMVRVQEISHF